MSAPGLQVTGQARIDTAALTPPLSLEFPGGAWTCLLGRSGVGKSTLLRAIAGLSGDVVWDGSLSASDGGAIEPRVSFMAQDDLLLPWASILDNVVLGARLRGEPIDNDKASEMLAQVGLTGFERRKPYSLSGGQRQRAALARTLMEDRAIVLLDEPFSALDAGLRTEMQDLAARVLAGRTVVMVTHDPAEAARLGQTILILTMDGAEPVPAPTTAIPRGVDDGAALGLQGLLFRKLRGEAA